MKFFYFLIRALVYIPTKIFYPVKIHNKKRFPKHKKIILASNHLSWKDILIISVNFPGFRHSLAKKEIAKNPIARFFGKSVGTIFVDRGKSDLATMRTVISALKKGNGLTVFPEGTRNKIDTNLQELKSGIVLFSVRGDAPIVPLYIDRKTKAFRKTHICVGESFELVEAENRNLNSSIIKQKVELITQKMTAVKEEMEEIHASKKSKNKNHKEE